MLISNNINYDYIISLIHQPFDDDKIVVLLVGYLTFSNQAMCIAGSKGILQLLLDKPFNPNEPHQVDLHIRLLSAIARRYKQTTLFNETDTYLYKLFLKVEGTLQFLHPLFYEQAVNFFISITTLCDSVNPNNVASQFVQKDFYLIFEFLVKNNLPYIGCFLDLLKTLSSLNNVHITDFLGNKEFVTFLLSLFEQENEGIFSYLWPFVYNIAFKSKEDAIKLFSLGIAEKALFYSEEGKFTTKCHALVFLSALLDYAYFDQNIFEFLYRYNVIERLIYSLCTLDVDTVYTVIKNIFDFLADLENFKMEELYDQISDPLLFQEFTDLAEDLDSKCSELENDESAKKQYKKAKKALGITCEIMKKLDDGVTDEQDFHPEIEQENMQELDL
ncbi:hypothetical protein GPJ56_008220 [Histomonas meleagridis]|uniref:uncharacterized protein n=1 Tax=Histomonas meleagridis TaxID=135588 RepID=UPI003559E394|nr:hypothetical protein GPJ56_008220 [Histomonas meleagridis]KAH0797241.1 hypothetical protein GO595_009923 [Histomonas meleagridis]